MKLNNGVLKRQTCTFRFPNNGSPPTALDEGPCKKQTKKQTKQNKTKQQQQQQQKTNKQSK